MDGSLTPLDVMLLRDEIQPENPVISFEGRGGGPQCSLPNIRHPKGAKKSDDSPTLEVGGQKPLKKTFEVDFPIAL